MIRIAVVVQRYGREVVGGAETLARNVAERLWRRGFDVTVLTTTAADYVTWENRYPAGESILKGVLIRRFAVEEPREIESFNRESDHFFASPPGERDESEWIRRQGPFCPGLIAALETEQENFDLFLFFTYLYYPTVAGIPVVKKPMILFPTAHDEAPLFLNAMKPVFEKPDVLMFLTQAEMDLVSRVFAPKKKMELVRTGLDTDERIDEKPFRARYNLVAHYLLYAGRIEKGKGLETVFNAFRTIRSKDFVDLVLIGKKLMEIPGDDGIKCLGYVSEEEKLAAFKGAMLSLQPSPLESLSITTLESFSQKTPVLVNRRSPALVEHINLSGAGFTYNDENELVEGFRKIYHNRLLRKRMGEAGYAYVREYFSWDKVIDRIETVIRETVAR